MRPLLIAPSYRSTDFGAELNIADKINIFFDRIRGWYVDIVAQLDLRVDNSRYAVITLTFSYFEMIAKYVEGYEGTDQNAEYFKRGLNYVFPQINEIQDIPRPAVDLLADLYIANRDTLYHLMFVPFPLGISDEMDDTFVGEGNVLWINPALLIGDLRRHIAEMEALLRNRRNTDERTNFEKRYDFERGLAPRANGGSNGTDFMGRREEQPGLGDGGDGSGGY